MKCHYYNINYVKCCTCKKLGKCSVFRSLSNEQKDKYLEFILDQIEKHPNKYELGVIMAQEKKPTNNLLVLNRDGSFCAQIKQEDIHAMGDQEKLSFKDKILLGINKAFTVQYKVEIKAMPLPDDIMEAPSPKKRTRKTT